MTTALRIDPRIQARRIAVRRVEGHRRLRRLGAVAAVAAALALAFAITRSPLLDVDHLRVDAVGVPSEQVLAATTVRRGQPMTAVDPATIADEVAALPTVRTAEVRRAWPGTVTIAVAPREPGVVLPSTRGDWVVADGEGAIMGTVAEPDEALVRIGGVEVAGRSGQLLPVEYRAAAGVAAALPDDLAARVAQVVVVEGGSIEARLADGGLIAFAPDGDHATAARAAAAVVATVSPGCVEVLDVSSPDAPVLRREPTC